MEKENQEYPDWETQYYLKELKESQDFKDFTSLECWKSSRMLRVVISELTKTFPDIEKKRLSNQMIRASRSVTNNIAEGAGRYYFKESLKFQFIARASLFELKDHLLIALEEKYIDDFQFSEIDQMITSSLKLLGGYIRYLIELNKKSQ